MFCSNCGENIDPRAQICPRCGAASSAATQPGPPAPGATPPNLPSLSPPPSAPMSAMPPAESQTDRRAVFSLVLGILSITCFWILAGIPAIILGHISYSAIRKSMGRLKGEGLAIAGLIMGYASTLLGLPVFLIIAAILIPNILRARITANESAAKVTMRALSSAETTYFTEFNAQGYAPDLATLGPGPRGKCGEIGPAHACSIDATLGCASETWCVKDAYKYHIAGIGSPATDYVITAAPVDSRMGSHSYCSTSDNVVRQRYGTVNAPVTSVEDCQSWSPY